MRRSASSTAPRFCSAMISAPLANQVFAVGDLANLTKPSYLLSLASVRQPVALATQALTPQAPGHHASYSSVGTPGKAQSAPPSSKSGAAAVEYGSRNRPLRASAKEKASPWSSNRLQRGAGSSRRILGTSPIAGLPQVRPNPSLKLTCYGRHCKPGLSHSYYRLSPGLQCLPPRAA